jgi:ATP-dependent Lon protease
LRRADQAALRRLAIARRFLPYRRRWSHSRIDSLESDSLSSVETEALATKVLELYSQLKGDGRRQLPPKVDRYLSDLSDPKMLADLIASTFVSDPLRRQRVLEELSVNQRLRLVIQYLREENGSAVA